MPGAGPRCHDPGHRLIAPRARRGSPLPASHRCRPGASKGARDARDHAKIIPSTANAATKSRPRSSVRRLLPPPAHPLPKTPPHQIPIDGTPLTQPPRVPSLKAFRRRPSAPVDRPRRAGIRNPAHEEQSPSPRASVGYRFGKPTLPARSSMGQMRRKRSLVDRFGNRQSSADSPARTTPRRRRPDAVACRQTASGTLPSPGSSVGYDAGIADVEIPFEADTAGRGIL